MQVLLQTTTEESVCTKAVLGYYSNVIVRLSSAWSVPIIIAVNDCGCYLYINVVLSGTTCIVIIMFTSMLIMSFVDCIDHEHN